MAETTWKGMDKQGKQKWENWLYLYQLFPLVSHSCAAIAINQAATVTRQVNALLVKLNQSFDSFPGFGKAKLDSYRVCAQCLGGIQATRVINLYPRNPSPNHNPRSFPNDFWDVVNVNKQPLTFCARWNTGK